MPNGSVSGHMAAGSTDPWSTRATQRPDRCDDDCTPACPACGGLKCSCRPRFFPGQLLTDRELNGLEQYVIDKNRLHNSYLHGWGVACGLEVVCDDCDSGHVVVRPGYAVAPCGDDIVLCGDQTVDVCALINSCEPRHTNCNHPYDTPPRDCAGGEKEWVLAVCYDERPVRGITAQLGAGDSPGCGRCGCGGSGSCGCNGGGSRSGRTGGGCNGGCAGRAGGCACGGSAVQPATSGRGRNPQCEPTQICEGYRFVVYPKPKDGRLDVPTGVGPRGDYMWAWLYANRSKFGPLIDRVLCCATKAMELRQSIREKATLTGAAGLAVAVDYAEAIAEFAEDFAIHKCSFVDRTRELRERARTYRPTTPDHAALPATVVTYDVSGLIRELDNVWMEIVSECLCSALLPACPIPPSTNCVPLAVVTIDGGDTCRIVDICNWSQRKILITWPTVSYWLSWLPWNRVWAWLQNLCCGSDGGRQAYQLLSLMFGVIFSQSATGTKGGAKASAAAPMAMTAAAMAAPAAGTGAAASAGSGGAAAPGGPAVDDPLAAAFDADNLLAHMLDEVDRTAREGPEATGAPAWMGLVSRVLDGTILTPRPVADPTIAELTRRLDAAEKTLKSQSSKIASLSKKGGTA